MNIENIKRVRDHIASLKPRRFSMVSYFGFREDGEVVDQIGLAKTNANALEGSCNSCACIAGHALAALAPNRPEPHDHMAVAGKLLGLKLQVAQRLFEPNNYDPYFMRHGRRLERVSLQEALRVLDHLIATGEVDWSVSRRAEGTEAAPVDGPAPGGPQ